MAAKCIFLFDVIVVGIDTPGQSFPDVNRLSVQVVFNKMPINITASRINVTEFQSGRNLEFAAETETLKATLDKCGLPVVVRYSGTTVGNGQMLWPAEVIDLISPKMSDLTHVGSVELTKGPDRVGSLELLCRLVVKCVENAAGDGDDNKRRKLDEVINPRDVFFVVGEAQKCPNPCDPCLDLWQDEPGDDKMNLDLARYRGVENKRIKPEEFQPPPSPACCELKKMAREYVEMIDSITNRVPKPHPNTRKQMPPLTGGGADDLCLCFAADHDHHDTFQGKKMENAPFNKEEPKTTLPPMNIKPIRFCPVCLNNMSWLPKLAACPKCGVKPMPVLEERQKEKKMTADQILMQYLGKSRNLNDDFCHDPCKEEAEKHLDPNRNESQTECRCTCKFGKLCAHCRIRNLCADIFQSEKKQSDCQKVEPKSSEDFCVINTSSKDCRPYLARVFSELRDLYDIKDTNKAKSEYDERCEQPTAKKDKNAPTQEPEKEKKDEKKGDKGPPKPPPRVYPGIQIGHKFCVDRKNLSVPRRMGWLWNVSSEAMKNGWRPGAVRKPIKNLMQFFLNPPVNPYEKCREIEQERIEQERQKPILNVTKKHGEIFITLRSTANRSGGPLQKPLVFKIVKSPLANDLRELKRELKDEGFEKCTCHKPVYLCVCRDTMEKHYLFSEIDKKCRNRCIDNVADKLVLSDTSESEMEFEVDVTPPAGVPRGPGDTKPRVVSHGTQWSKKDLTVKPKYPIKLDPYYRRYDCAVGDRYTGVAFGQPGEEVFEDGAFGLAGGGPHGTATGAAARARQLAAMGGPGARGGGGRGGRGGGIGGGGPFGKGGPFGPGGPGIPGGAGGGGGGGGKSGPIPVRGLKRDALKQAQADAAQKEAADKVAELRKKGPDMMAYLKKSGGGFKKQEIGPDGLTDTQRKRRLDRLKLFERPLTPLCMIKHRRKPINPCDPCAGSPCDPRWIC